MVQPFLTYELDLLLEAISDGTDTVGRTRALFRTAWSAAALVAPLLLGALLVSSDSYDRVFVAAAAALAPLIIFFNANRLPRGPSPKLVATKNSLRHILRNRDLSAVIAGNFFLYLFLAWAPLYAPLYLHDVVGIAWSNLGWMFAVMLLPYSLLEYPASWLADRYLGDKELMAVGFLVAGGGLAALAFVTPTTSLVNVLIILIVSRAGAALIEAMVDAHFFRRVSRRDINSVGIFRATWPLSFAIAPAIGSLLLLCGGYSALFLWTGACVTIGGTVCAFLIKDFK
jgi:MFS family permease